MEECKYCDEEFESEREMHLHWAEEHEDELSSHDQEKVKKARKQKEQEKESRIQKRRKTAGKVLAVGGLLLVAVVLGQQAIDSLGGSTANNLDLEGQPMIGNENASVTVVEFGDYKCPHCRDFDTQVYPQMKEEYIDTGQVKFYHVNFAFLGDASTQAAVASECVYQQTGDSEQFWNYHHAIFENQGIQFTTDSLMTLAEENTEGLDYDSLRQCISQRQTLSEVQSDRQMGSANGVDSTPTIFVNGTVAQNNYNSVKAAIEQELQ